MFSVIYGNIFTSPSDAIVNPVNCVGVMGAGLAKQFRSHYPAMYKAYRTDCNHNQFKPGDCKFYAPTIFCLATKNHWKNPSKLEWIKAGLQNLRNLVEQTTTKNNPIVLLPALGCGLGGLSLPNQVKPLMEEILNPSFANFQLVLQGK